MSATSQSNQRDIKRIPMACTRCRGMKLKCRVSDGESQCKRCIDSSKDCLFIPVSSEHPAQTQPQSSSTSHIQFRVMPPIGSNGFQQYPPAQPTTSAQHSWDTQNIPLHPSRIPIHPEFSYSDTTNHYGNFVPQQTQLPYQTSPGFPPFQTLQPSLPLHGVMGYPIQGIHHNDQTNIHPQNVADPAFDPTRFGQYNQQSPNAAPWTSYNVAPPEDTTQYYNFYGSQGRAD